MSSAFEQITQNHQARHAQNPNQLRCDDCGGYVSESRVVETTTAVEWVCGRCGPKRKSKL